MPSSRGTTPGSDIEFDPGSISWELMTSPLPPVMTSAGSLSIKDLRMLHQWSTATAGNVAIGPRACNTLLISVPQLAFEHNFLLNGILGIASLQVQRQYPGSVLVKRETDVYRTKAVKGFREAIGSIKSGSNLYEAALIMSILLIVLYSTGDALEKDELLIVNWLVLYRGLSTIMSMEDPKYIESLSVSPIFIREPTTLMTLPAIPRILVEMFAGIHPLDPDYPVLECWCRVLDALGSLYASLQQDGLFSQALHTRIIAWPSYTTPEFTTSARERRPRVLVVLTYYLAFLKLVRGLWWTEGIPDREINAIARIVGPEWTRYMDVPLRITTISDPQEMANLLLS